MAQRATVTIERTGGNLTATLTMPSGTTQTRRGTRSDIDLWVTMAEISAMGAGIAVKVVDRT